MYTGMGEAIGVYRLTDLFRAANKDILLRQSRHVNAADLKYRNVILLGSIYVNEWTRTPARQSRASTTLSRRRSRTAIRSRARSASTSRSSTSRRASCAVDYALITVKPNVSGEHAVMTLAGIFSEGTEAAAEFVTTRNHLAVLGQRLRQTRRRRRAAEVLPSAPQGRGRERHADHHHAPRPARAARSGKIRSRES